MKPPSIYEELHYAKEFRSLLDKNGEHEKSRALWEQIEQAETWDNGAVFSIRELFKNGYGMAGGHSLDFADQFDKDGVYPVYADRADYASQYIYRWTNAREYKNLDSLPFFGENDVIANSQTMDYEYQTLVLKKEALPPEKQTPENSLWVVNTEIKGNHGTDSDKLITAENPITGEIADWERSDFHGVLRSEKTENINFKAITAEYQARNAEKEHSAGDIKPSILKAVEDNKSKIAESDRTGKQDPVKKQENSIDDLGG